MNEACRDDLLPAVWRREALLLSAGGEPAGGRVLEKRDVELRMKAPSGGSERRRLSVNDSEPLPCHSFWCHPLREWPQRRQSELKTMLG